MVLRCYGNVEIFNLFFSVSKNMVDYSKHNKGRKVYTNCEKHIDSILEHTNDITKTLYDDSLNDSEKVKKVR